MRTAKKTHVSATRETAPDVSRDDTATNARTDAINASVGQPANKPMDSVMTVALQDIMETTVNKTVQTASHVIKPTAFVQRVELDGLDWIAHFNAAQNVFQKMEKLFVISTELTVHLANACLDIGVPIVSLHVHRIVQPITTGMSHVISGQEPVIQDVMLVTTGKRATTDVNHYVTTAHVTGQLACVKNALRTTLAIFVQRQVRCI